MSARAANAELVRALRDEGLLQREIAEQTGLSRSYVASLIVDPAGDRDRERKASYGGLCVDCGEPTSGGEGPAHVAERCVSCTNHTRKYWTHEVVVAAIQEWARRRGHPPISDEWITKNIDPDGYRFPPRSAVYRAGSNSSAPFESWADAVEAAGFRRPTIGDKTTRWRKEGRVEDSVHTGTNGATRKTVTRPYVVLRANDDGALVVVGDTDACSTQEAVENLADGEGTWYACPRSALQVFTLRSRIVAERVAPRPQESPVA